MVLFLNHTSTDMLQMLCRQWENIKYRLLGEKLEKLRQREANKLHGLEESHTTVNEEHPIEDSSHTHNNISVN